ncbi:MAG: MFS transporter [Pseudomonadales bacterium]
MTAAPAKPVAIEAVKPKRLLDYRRHKELDFLPTGALRWLLVLVIVWIFCVEQLERLKIGSVLPYLFEEFGVGISDWGKLGMMGAVASALGALIMSNVAERYGRYICIVYSILAMTALSVMIALAQSWITVSVLYLGVCFVISAAGPATHAALRDLTPRMGRAFAFSLLSMGMTGGALLATSTAAFTMPVWPGWRPQFWLAAAVGGFTFLLALIFYRDLSARVRAMIHERHAEPEPAPVVVTFETLDAAERDGMKIYRDWRTWILSTSMLFWAITYVGVAMYVPLYLVEEHAMEVWAAAELTSVFFLVFTVSLLGSGWLSDRMGLRKIVTAAGGLATGAGFVVLAALPQGTDPTLLGALFAFLGFTAGFIYPAFCALMSENAEEVSPFAVARAFGIMNVIAQLGIFVLNLVVPWVRESFGWQTWMFTSGVLCIGIAVAVGFGRGPWLLVRER